MSEAAYALPHKAELYGRTNTADDIRNMLRVRGFKQLDLAKAMKCSDAYVSDMLKGRRNMTPKFLNAVLDFLAVDGGTRLSLNKQAARESGWLL